MFDQQQFVVAALVARPSPSCHLGWKSAQNAPAKFSEIPKPFT